MPVEFTLGGRGKYVGLVVTVDDADWPEVSKHVWYGHRPPGLLTTYARTTLVGPDGSKRHVSLHNLIMGVRDGLDIDHGDGNGLNNQRGNLEFVTRAENMRRAYRRSDTYLEPRAGHHVKPVRKRLASGEVRTYYYDRRTLERLTEEQVLNRFR